MAPGLGLVERLMAGLNVGCEWAADIGRIADVSPVLRHRRTLRDRPPASTEGSLNWERRPILDNVTWVPRTHGVKRDGGRRVILNEANKLPSRSFLFLRNGGAEPEKVDWAKGIGSARQAIAEAMNAKNMVTA